MSLSESSVSSGASADPFRDLGLLPDLCDAVAKAGYTKPTPIQDQAIPILLDGIDLLGCAQTGSGKTAAFALPILHRLLRRPAARGRNGVRALVLAPTRELAAQIGACFGTYGAAAGVDHLVVFGGVNKNPQVRALRNAPEVLVACPGRLLDLIQNDGLRLDDVEYVVLDEADRMLDMGFIHDVRKIMAVLPEQRQTMLFSATMPAEIEKLGRKILIDPERVAVDAISSTAEPISQAVYFVASNQKQALLTRLLSADDITSALVFTRTKHGANRVAQKLERAGIGAAAIHGNKSQNARERAMNGFRSGELKVVVATDLASRGIDVRHLSHVINFDLPNIPETYVHRVGRTGRAGATGVAWSLCSDEERPFLRDIERLTSKRLERLSVEGEPLPEEGPEPPRENLRSPRPRGRGPGRGRHTDGGGRSSGGGGGGGRAPSGGGGGGGRSRSNEGQAARRDDGQGSSEPRPSRQRRRSGSGGGTSEGGQNDRSRTSGNGGGRSDGDRTRSSSSSSTGNTGEASRSSRALDGALPGAESSRSREGSGDRPRPRNRNRR